MAAVAAALLLAPRYGIAVAAADEPEAPQSAAPDPAEPLLAAVKGQSATSRTDRRDKPSEAEYIARLQRAIEGDRNQLEELICEQDDPQGEFPDAKAEFERFDAERAELHSQIEELKRFGKQREVAELEERLAALESDWKTAKERFDLAIQVRKALREKVTSLQEKIQKDTQTLQSLTGPPQEELAEAAAPTPVDAAKIDAPKPTEAATNAVQDSGGLTSSALKMSPAIPGVEAAIQTAGSSNKKRPTPALVEAQAEALAKLAAAHDADEKAKSAASRVETLKKNIAVEQQLLDLARAKADSAQQAWAALNEELQGRLAEDPASLVKLTKKIDQAAERVASAQADSQASQQRLGDLRVQLTGVQREKIETLHEADDKHAEANDAQGKVDRLQNPFTLTNITQWLLDHGPKLIAILLGTLAIYLAVKLLGRQLAKALARTSRRGTVHERENRAVTLMSVFRNVAMIAVMGGGTLMALDEVGIPIVPLMGGAAVAGLAVAFGAQNLVRDYFGGFMVLLEDQYGIGDVVKIGDIAGAVEQITLRVTALRDLEGTVHFIPHGSITTVSNMTHGWSRALLDVGVAYKEDADRVMEVMLDVARTLRNDATFGPVILGDAEMLGVDNLGDSAVVIKMCVKTQPLKRWAVKRELLRRIKARFDELGIEIPFPHRTVFLHHSDGKQPKTAALNGERSAA